MSGLFIYDSPGKQFRLKNDAYDGERSPIELARPALDALFLFAENFCEPLSVDLSLACFSRETGFPAGESRPPRPFWLAHKRELPPGVKIKPGWADEELTTADELKRDSILDWLRVPFAQECEAPVREILGWEDLMFPATRVRLPFPAHTIGGNTLPVHHGMGIIEHPVERTGEELWVSGPLTGKTVTAPIELRLQNDAGILVFDIWLLWSVWVAEQAEGRQQVEEAIGKVLSRGWKLSD